MDETPYVETLEPGEAGGSPDGAGGSKLPPVLANLMGSMGAGKSPQGPGGGGINVQEILTSIMVRPPASPPLCLERLFPLPRPCLPTRSARAPFLLTSTVLSRPCLTGQPEQPSLRGAAEATRLLRQDQADAG